MTCPSPSVQDLIEEGQGLVRSLAMRIHRKLPRNVDVEDLIAYGQVGLVEAARDFDPARGNQFSTYAYYRVRGAIYDGLSKMNWFGRSHYEHVRYEQMANETLRESALESGGKPKGEESESEEVNARWHRNLSWSLLAVYLTTQMRADENGESDSVQWIDPSVPTPSTILVGRETCQKLRELIEKLPSEEMSLIRAVYFENLTLEEAGRKIGVSKSWASRMHAKILRRLAQSLRLSGLA